MYFRNFLFCIAATFIFVLAFYAIFLRGGSQKMGYEKSSSAPVAIEAESISVPMSTSAKQVVSATTSVALVPATPKAATTKRELPVGDVDGNAKVVVTTTASKSVIQETAPEVADPSFAGDINQRDVWMLTNLERQKVGLPSLVFSMRLSAVAEAKVLDMISQQYFEHVSPSGIGIKDLAEKFGYKYLSIGENLALGDFASSSHVVDGWMNSPGHRANILKKDFTEIGVSAIRGNYQGRNVWFAVQEFGRPLSDCPPPDELLQKKITIFSGQLTGLESSLHNLEIEMANPKGDVAVHNAYVRDYNTVVTLYNSILATTKTDIAVFNKQVALYNLCLKGE